MVALQEVWLKRDQERLIKKSGFKYHVAYPGPSWIFGSGLVILSKFKILAHDFHKFVVRGFPHRVHEGDFHASKGIGYALLDTPLGKIPLFVTHLIAKYAKRHESDINRVFRLAQMLELVFYIRRKASPQSFVLCGDLNASEGDMELETLHALTGASSIQPSRLRSFRKRLDHVICGGTFEDINLKVVSSSLVFRGTANPETVLYSDHEGVSAVIRAESGKVDTKLTLGVLKRTFRYMSYSMKSVIELEQWLRVIPLLGPLSSHLMKPQFAYIQFLLDILEADIRQAVPQHPLRLKEIM